MVHDSASSSNWRKAKGHPNHSDVPLFLGRHVTATARLRSYDIAAANVQHDIAARLVDLGQFLAVPADADPNCRCAPMPELALPSQYQHQCILAV